MREPDDSIHDDQDSATLKVGFDHKPIEEIHEDLLYISIGVVAIMFMLWGIAKRLDDLEVALIKLIRGASHGSSV
jgi:hypothetical protein